MPGHNNWYTVSNNPFTVKFNPYKFKPMSFDSAADYTAKLIAEKYDNIYIGLSGGLDSEYVAKVFLRNKIAFTPIIWKDPYCREVDYALYFCEKNNLKYHLIEKDFLDKVVFTSLKKAAKKYNSTDVVGALNIILIKTVENNNGHFITSTGMPIISGENYPAPIDNSKTEFVKCEFYIEIDNANHPGSFFCYTPELLYAYTKNIDADLSVQEAKCKLYDMPFRPKLKPYHVGMVYNLDSDLSSETFDYGSLVEFESLFNQAID